VQQAKTETESSKRQKEQFQLNAHEVAFA